MEKNWCLLSLWLVLTTANFIIKKGAQRLGTKPSSGAYKNYEMIEMSM